MIWLCILRVKLRQLERGRLQEGLLEESLDGRIECTFGHHFIAEEALIVTTTDAIKQFSILRWTRDICIGPFFFNSPPQSRL